MPDENPTPDPAHLFDVAECEVLHLLTKGDQPIWSPDDLGRVLMDRIKASDAIGALRRAGLIHQTSDGHVFAAHAGVRAMQVCQAV